MSIAPLKEDWRVVDVDGSLPGHLELPQDNGEFVDNFLQFPQSYMLVDVLLPLVERLHPDGRYALGCDVGIYWRLTDPPERGVIVPDLMYVPGVARLPTGEPRRSYVLWKEKVAPEIVMEFSLDDGAHERDRTPLEGKFWIYEHAIQAGYYVIFVIQTAELEVYRLDNGVYRELVPNAAGRFLFDPLGLELGVWHARFMTEKETWLRWYNRRGELIPLSREQAELESRRARSESQRANAARHAEQAARQDEQAARQDAEAERRAAEDARRGEAAASQRALAEHRRAELLAAKLKELGIDPESL